MASSSRLNPHSRRNSVGARLQALDARLRADDPPARRGPGPFEVRWVAPDERWLVEAHGLDDLDSLLARHDGQVVTGGSPGCNVLRLVVPHDASLTRVVYLKREVHRGWGPATFRWTHRGHFATRVGREFDILRQASTAGLACRPPLAFLQSGLFWPRACLVLAERAGMVPLNEFLAARPFAGAGGDGFFTLLGREVARLHAAGFDHPDLFSIHIGVEQAGAAWQIAFLDLAGATRRAELSLRRRARSLAALLATLPPRLAGEPDRAIFVDAYLFASQLEDRAGQLQEAVDHAVQRLLRQRRIWEMRESDGETQRSVRRLDALEPGRFWIDAHYRSALERASLASFDAIMQTTRGRQLRALKDRENWRLEFEAEGTVRGAYLKKHHLHGARNWLRAKFGLGAGATPGRVEARNVAQLNRAGIAAMRLIAFGEKLHRDGRLESFVLTEELVGYTQLDHFLRYHFPPWTAVSRRRQPHLDQLIRDVADVARRFHQMGYNHRDLYCCHFFIKELGPGRFQVNLIDLQRVEHRRGFRRRWIVKDLAQLAYSAPRDRITCTHKLAFLKHYLGVSKLRPSDKRLIRQVVAKQRLMEWNLGKHP